MQIEARKEDTDATNTVLAILLLTWRIPQLNFPSLLDGRANPEYRLEQETMTFRI